MAAEVPVKDVLCEAMEYLSKLGANLRSRSENLKEKKIRGDKLTNALAVQKAADKVLLICELSKKSLSNVEDGIRKVLEHIDVSQASSSVGGKSSNLKSDDRDSKRDKPKYNYFDYKSRKLKIKNKISLKHYKSVKVLVKKMSKSLMDVYPVHHDCKLYQMRRREESKTNKQLVQNNSETNTFKTNKNRRRSSDKSQRRIRNKIIDSDDQDDSEDHKINPMDINDGSDNQKENKPNVDGYSVIESNVTNKIDEDTSSNTQLVQNNSETDTSVTNEVRRRSSDKTKRNNRNKIIESDDQDDSEDHKINPMDINDGSDNQKENKPNVDGYSVIESNVTNKIDEDTSSNTQLVQNNSETDTSVTNEVRRRSSDKTQRNNRNKIIESDDQDDNEKEEGPSVDGYLENESNITNKNDENTSSNKLLVPSNSEPDTSVTNAVRRKSSDKTQRKVRNRIEDSDDQDDTEEHEKKLTDKHEVSDNQQEEGPSVHGYSENERNNTNIIDEPEPKKRKLSINDKEKLNVNTDDSDNINFNPTCSKNDKNDSENDSKIPMIKCVSLSKLLKPDVIEKDPAMTSVLKSGKNKLNNKLEFDVAKKNEMLQTAKKNKEEFWIQKRKEVNAFKPKMFVINIIRLPSLNTDYLIENRLKKITKEGKTICEIAKDISDSLTKNINKNKSKQTSGNPVLSNDSDDEQLVAEAIKVKNALLYESDSDNGLDTISKYNEKEAETTVERIKNALLNSDSDQNGDASDTNSNKKCETEKSKDTQNQLNSDNNGDGNKTKISKKKSESDKTKTVIDCEAAKNDLLDKSDSENKSEKSDKSNKEKNKNNSENENDFVGLESQEEQKTPEKGLAASNDDNAKKSLLNDSSDDATEIPLDQRKVATSQSKKKRIRESVQAKNALLRYSSGSETEDEKLRNTLNNIKKSLLECMSDDENKLKVKNLDQQSRSSEQSSSSAEDIVQKQKQNSKKVKKKKRCLKSSSEEEKNDSSDDDHKSTSNREKMVRSKAKPGNSSSHSSDAQDSIEKDIDGLTNLRTLNKVRRRNSNATEESDSSKSTTVRSRMAAKPTGLISEDILEAESSSDAASNDDDDVIDEDLPSVTLPGFNGGLEHLVKEDLLRESDSSVSNKEEEIKEESDEEERLNARRRKANAIASSDSETSTVRKKVKDDAVRMSDFEDSDDSDINKRSKRKKKGSESDGSVGSSDTGKKKRRRIKSVNDSDVSGSDSENEGKNKHGRKNIRKVMGKNQLEEATKKAAREEKERVARIAERQKMYNNMQFDESGKPDEVVLDKVVLDFDPETKEPLIAVDCGLVKKLKPHQANGIKFMWDACFESVKRIKKDKGSGCILAHCMGLGKTLQVVALTHTLLAHDSLTKVHRVLVVCPLSTVLNWVNEFKMWLKFALRDSDIDVYELSRFKQNSERAFQMSQWFEHGGVCVLGYEMFRNLSADNNKKFKKKMLKNFQEALVDPGPDLVVCDEGHLLKNEKTSLSQSMNKVRTHRRIVLTGTPLQNNLKEYYCMVTFVKPNLLGKYNEYLNRFVNPITNGQYTDSTEHDIKIMKRRSHVLHKMLDGAVQRRDYGVLAPFLPPKHEYVLFITLTEVQTKLYQYYLDNYSRRPLPGKSSGFLFPDFQSLQRIWTHPLVLKYNSERYEIMQQKKRDKEEEDSEGSLVDFIDDDSTPDESSSADSSDDSSELSDDSRKKSKKKKSSKKNKGKDKDKDKESAAASRRRGTRANPIDLDLEDDKGDDVLEVKNENPTEWWIKMVEEDVLEDLRNSHKLVLLFDILRQCETIGDKLLVFSQSLYSLDLIEHFLGKVDEATQDGRIDEKLGNHVGSWSPGIDYFRLDGSTSCENRSIWCKNFNREDNPRARLFLISTRAGGLGINLVAANRVVIFDVSWNPSHDVQSIFRVYRFGQKKPCYVYRFLAMGTMEEKIYERQVTKQAISKRVIDEQQIDRHYAENDLAELYKFEAEPPSPRPIPPLPKDRLFAEMLREHEAQIYKYHEHDSLLENKEEETLSEEERKAAWEDFENEKNRPPPAPFPSPWPMHNGMVPNLLAQQQQQLAYAALAAMLRKDMPNVNDNQIRDMLPMIYNANPALMQKMSEIYKYSQQMNMTPAMMAQASMNPVNSGGPMAGMGGTSGLEYEPPWLRQQKQQQQMRLQQLMAQQQNMGAASNSKYYAGGLGSRDPVAMALQQQRAREIMVGGGAGRPRGRPPLQPRAPPTPSADVVNLDSD